MLREFGSWELVIGVRTFQNIAAFIGVRTFQNIAYRTFEYINTRYHFNALLIKTLLHLSPVESDLAELARVILNELLHACR